MENIIKAQTIIRNNSRGNFTIPCSKLYPFQWNWDSAFTALGIFSYDQDRAIKEIDMLIEGQWDNGMIPQIIFHTPSDTYFPGADVWNSKTNPKTSCITQPPVITTVVWYMILLGYNNKDKLNFIFDKLLKYHLWFAYYRDPLKKGLISIFHPWESGRDNSPDWDDALNAIEVDNSLNIPRKDNQHINNNLRPTDDDYNRYIQIVYKCQSLNWDNHDIYFNGLFNVCDPGVQFIYIKACKDLYKIAIYLDRKEHYKKIIELICLYENGCSLLWNQTKHCYSTLNIKTNKLYDEISCGSMLYAYADIGTPEQCKHMLNHSKRILKLSKYGFPSWDPSNYKFNKHCYWRGPIWCIINFLLCIGFLNKKEMELYNNIKKHTIQLIENEGFCEYYDPLSGKGYGGKNFSWTAAIYLCFKNNNIV